MKQVVANLDNDWTLTGAEVDAFLRSNPRGVSTEAISIDGRDAVRLLLTCRLIYHRAQS